MALVMFGRLQMACYMNFFFFFFFFTDKINEEKKGKERGGVDHQQEVA